MFRLLLDSKLVSSRNYFSMVFQESFIGNIFINQFDMDSVASMGSDNQIK